jgi:hypothetical protein
MADYTECADFSAKHQSSHGIAGIPPNNCSTGDTASIQGGHFQAFALILVCEALPFVHYILGK